MVIVDIIDDYAEYILQIKYLWQSHCYFHLFTYLHILFVTPLQISFCF